MRTAFLRILPNAASPVIVATAQPVGGIVLPESAPSLLGLGIQPPISGWGNMPTDAQETIYEAPMLAVRSGLAIFATVVESDFLGDGLQDALDPRALAR